MVSTHEIAELFKTPTAPRPAGLTRRNRLVLASAWLRPRLAEDFTQRRVRLLFAWRRDGVIPKRTMKTYTVQVLGRGFWASSLVTALETTVVPATSQPPQRVEIKDITFGLARRP